MSDERLQWIGVGLVAAVAVVFIWRLIRVIRGRSPTIVLYREAAQDIAFLCLGAGLMFPRGSTGRLVLMAICAVILGGVLLRRFLDRRPSAKKG
jgi:hypothetical protein